jgi:hypothetical protein
MSNGITPAPFVLTEHEKSEFKRMADAVRDRDHGLSILMRIASNRESLNCADYDWVMTRYRAWLVFDEVRA